MNLKNFNNWMISKKILLVSFFIFSSFKVWTAPLHIAVREGNYEKVEYLLEGGADINARTFFYETALHYASKYGQLEIAEILLEYGADVNARTFFYETPLHKAFRYNYIKVAKLLIKYGADLNVEDRSGKTPLDHVANRGLFQTEKSTIY